MVRQTKRLLDQESWLQASIRSCIFNCQSVHEPRIHCVFSVIALPPIQVSSDACPSMLQRSCRLRKLVQQVLVNATAVKADANSIASTSTPCRHFSLLPKDYASHKVVMPVRAARRAELNSQQPAADTQASSSNTPSASTSAAALQQGAQTGVNSEATFMQLLQYQNNLGAFLENCLSCHMSVQQRPGCSHGKSDRWMGGGHH